jgi:hypothetical protein
LYSGIYLYFLLLFNQPISTRHRNHTIIRNVRQQSDVLVYRH